MITESLVIGWRRHASAGWSYWSGEEPQSLLRILFGVIQAGSRRRNRPTGITLSTLSHWRLCSNTLASSEPIRMVALIKGNLRWRGIGSLQDTGFGWRISQRPSFSSCKIRARGVSNKFYFANAVSSHNPPSRSDCGTLMSLTFQIYTLCEIWRKPSQLSTEWVSKGKTWKRERIKAYQVHDPQRWHESASTGRRHVLMVQPLHWWFPISLFRRKC